MVKWQWWAKLRYYKFEGVLKLLSPPKLGGAPYFTSGVPEFGVGEKVPFVIDSVVFFLLLFAKKSSNTSSLSF